MTPNQYLLLLLALVAIGLLFYAVRFLISIFTDRSYLPKLWEQGLRSGSIPEKVKQIEKSFPDKVRFFALYFLAVRLGQQKVMGAFAEAGVYKGETARLLHHADPHRRLHLFDTFSGFMSKDLQLESGEASTYTSRHFSDTSVQKVLDFIGGNQNVMMHPGDFQETVAGMKEEQYALVSLDMDLYAPTKAALEYFYPRMSPGGVILVHDYNDLWPGIRQAVDEFGQGIPESFVLLPDMDSTVLLAKIKTIS